ncbi:L-threonylcarbamoyladenylate synthase [Alkalihalobacillus trypoxylicola]|uniref:Threonylcarbamoyl-AMP synthase n=1 Tax=Alkalihalobacillus trypoxylicola TaxID=519424 RepID=A0A162DD20_9BACI|nr:L-threonylcarbamoyladenylate synthase [Alkalihalobacillus trypoxylicola]KYG29235.1 tRNA threonylcarbamoyladenosine biosynthesis protein [Alkalihalobacillus trypoxylicola]
MNEKETKRWHLDNDSQNLQNHPSIIESAKLLRQGEVIAFPTETVYGLGANALDPIAIEQIFKAKGRPSDNPLIVHIANRDQLEELVQGISPVAERLIDAFWPGPLTLIFDKKGVVANNVTAGLNSVAIRMPNHSVALSLLLAADLPLAAPSANLSGKPSPTNAEHVWQDLKGKISGVLDGGATGLGLESTVLDLTTSVPTLYRPGGITQEEIESVIGPIHLDPALKVEKEKPKSPGMKYTHYAPSADLFLVRNRQDIPYHIEKAQKEGRRVGVLTVDEHSHDYGADVVISCGTNQNLKTVAQQLYGTLRRFDQEEVDVIFSETFLEEGLGKAIMNRLDKAAAKRYL